MASRRVQAGRKPWAAADYQIGVPVPGLLNAASAALFRALKRLLLPGLQVRDRFGDGVQKIGQTPYGSCFFAAKHYGMALAATEVNTLVPELTSRGPEV
jgi:hypothetical protein